METLAVLAFVWALIFAMLLLPARRVGTWIARTPDGFAGTALSILRCFVLACSLVLLGWLALTFGGRTAFPHVKPEYFGLSYVAAVLFAPAFAVLITGYLQARMIGGRQILSERTREFLAALVLLALSAVLLGFGGRSLLKWYETGRIANRYRDLTFAAEPYLFSFEVFRSGLAVVLGLLGFVAFFAICRNIRRGWRSRHREDRCVR